MEGRKKTGVDNGGVRVVLLPCRGYSSPPVLLPSDGGWREWCG